MYIHIYSANLVTQAVSGFNTINLITGKNGVGKTYFLQKIAHQRTLDIPCKYIGTPFTLESVLSCERGDLSYLDKDILTILRSINPNIDGVKYNSSGSVDWIEYKNCELREAYVCGDSVKTVLHISVIPLIKNGILLLDQTLDLFYGEVANSVIKVLVHLTEEFNIQLFVVTNNNTIIDGFLCWQEKVSVARIRKKDKIYCTLITGVDAYDVRSKYNMELRI